MGPWFYRGGAFCHGTGAGVFVFTNGLGDTNRNDSFREITMLKKFKIIK